MKNRGHRRNHGEWQDGIALARACAGTLGVWVAFVSCDVRIGWLRQRVRWANAVERYQEGR